MQQLDQARLSTTTSTNQLLHLQQMVPLGCGEAIKRRATQLQLSSLSPSQWFPMVGQLQMGVGEGAWRSSYLRPAMTCREIGGTEPRGSAWIEQLLHIIRNLPLFNVIPPLHHGICAVFLVSSSSLLICALTR